MRSESGELCLIDNNTCEINHALAAIIDEEVFFLHTDTETIIEVIHFLR